MVMVQSIFLVSQIHNQVDAGGNLKTCICRGKFWKPNSSRVSQQLSKSRDQYEQEVTLGRISREHTLCKGSSPHPPLKTPVYAFRSGLSAKMDICRKMKAKCC